MRRQKVSKDSRKEWGGRWCLSLAFTFSLLFPASGSAQADSAPVPGLQRMVYEVYAGGIHAVQSDLIFDFTKKGRYKVEMAATTRGFLGRLVPWSGTFESEGWVVKKDDLRPQLHKSTAVWRKEREIKEYNYTKDRKFKSLVETDHEKPPRQKDIDDELTQGTTDALTATLTALQNVTAKGACTGESEVFDGSRRFKLVFKDQGVVALKSSRYNIYEGPATECTVEVVPVAGKWHEKPRGWLSIQEQGRKKGTMPTVWIAKMDKGAPAVPVKVRVKTDYGTLFMHLAEHQGENGILVADKRAD